ncbi:MULTISPECIES: MucR family transcriptional regulator [Brucella]|uniref:Transcriptional regulator n=1 Tax=Brucella pecoris TaxID=867683 RepID=A0A5C5CDH8_9HYPH|nr:MucR family transcriptional regulator [Brucella pecoris]TNV08826.1 transcriptional regulator [Brucella pecoris]
MPRLSNLSVRPKQPPNGSLESKIDSSVNLCPRALISQVHSKLVELNAGQSDDERIHEEPKPAVNPKRSVFNDYIICLEDGKRFKALKRHLNAQFNMTPNEYRSKWGLPQDYPMVAPNYAAKRSELAKSVGLARKPKTSNQKTSRKNV